MPDKIDLVACVSLKRLVRLEFTYFAETENFLLKVLWIKVKIR